MKVFACLIWYDESPSWLAACAASAAKLCDHLIAVDGSYYLFPEAEPRSGPEQVAALYETALATGMGCTIHVPSEPFYGNEVEKRTLAFSLLNQLAEPERDWVLVIDADEIVSHVPHDVKARLEETEHDAAQVRLFERIDPASEVARFQPFVGKGAGHAHRMLFRCLPELRVQGAHYHYTGTREGLDVLLWGDKGDSEVATALDLTDLKVEHRRHLRTPARNEQAARYYALREQLGTERREEVASR